MSNETILIVDDEPANLAVLNQVLYGRYRVRAANSGMRALQVAGTEPRPDLILLDIVMPEMDGCSVLSRLKEDPATSDIPVIFVTDLESIADEENGLEMGAVDYITKPITPAILLARVRNHLVLKQASDFLRDKNAYLEAEVARRVEDNRIMHKERSDMERQLNQTHKMEAIGQLAGGIAHEINTPIQYVGDNLSFIQRSWGEYSELLVRYGQLLEAAREIPVLHSLIKQVEDEIEQCDMDFLEVEIPTALQQSINGVIQVARIVRSMKEFARPSNGKMDPTDINKVIENALTVCKNEWKYVAEAITEYDSQLPQVPCLAVELSQVIFNLVVNAAHAIEAAELDQKGQIAISTRVHDGMAEVRISDTGAGVPEAIRQDIFNPFFTTKSVGKGTGQGLAIAQDIVRKHHGALTMESDVGRGSTFIIRLPLTQQGAESQEG